MKKIILSQPGCSKCKMLSAQCPDAEVVELAPDKLLMLARELNIQSLPIIVLANGELDEYVKLFNQKGKK